MGIKIKQQYVGTGGDTVHHYNAEFVTNPTLEEFVEWVIKNHPKDWGEINSVRNAIYVEYEEGKIVRRCKNYSSIKGRKISLKYVDGGWSMMDYTVKLEKEEILK